MAGRRKVLVTGLLTVFAVPALVGCGMPAATPTRATVAPAQSTPIAVSTNPASNPFILAEPGPFFVASREYRLIDESRGGREIGIIIMYPALKQTDVDGRVISRDATPEMSSAPYPMILTSPNSGSVIFGSHLASYGFVMIIVEYPTLYEIDYWDVQVIDHPRDLLFALDEIASNPPEGLEGVINPDHVGVAGYSSDGDKALVLSGARINPDFYLSQCAEASSSQSPSLDRWVGWVCALSVDWDNFVFHVGSETTSSDDELWQPVTDERIRAVMPMGAGGAWLFGERGLASADRPTFIIAGTEDDVVPYLLEPGYIFEHLGTPERHMVSFVGQDHMMVFDAKQVDRINHFATAFFGYYLQGKSEYRSYFSEDFVSQFDDLTWGVYEAK